MVRYPLILLMTLGLVSCGTLQKRMSESYVDKKIAEQKVDLPDLPDFCDSLVYGVIPKVGENWRWVNLRWEVVLENINKERAACGVWYRDLQKSYKEGIK